MKSREYKPYSIIQDDVLYHNPCKLFEVAPTSSEQKKRAGDSVTYLRKANGRILLDIEMIWDDVDRGGKAGYVLAGNEFQEQFNNLA